MRKIILTIIAAVTFGAMITANAANTENKQLVVDIIQDSAEGAHLLEMPKASPEGSLKVSFSPFVRSSNLHFGKYRITQKTSMENHQFTITDLTEKLSDGNTKSALVEKTGLSGTPSKIEAKIGMSDEDFCRVTIYWNAKENTVNVDHNCTNATSFHFDNKAINGNNIHIYFKTGYFEEAQPKPVTQPAPVAPIAVESKPKTGMSALAILN